MGFDLLTESRTREIIFQNDRLERMVGALLDHQLRTCALCAGTGRLQQAIGTGSYAWGKEGTPTVVTTTYDDQPCRACRALREARGETVVPTHTVTRERTLG